MPSISRTAASQGKQPHIASTVNFSKEMEQGNYHFSAFRLPKKYYPNVNLQSFMDFEKLFKRQNNSSDFIEFIIVKITMYKDS